jgi:hypothetical protein
MRRLLNLVLLTAGLASAAPLDFGAGIGVKAGVPFVDLLQATGSTMAPSPVLSQGDNYIVGPVAELRLPFGFAIEADGLYRGTSYGVANVSGVAEGIKSSSWEIPYLAKFRFPIPLLKPFVLAGGAYRIFNDLPSGVTATHNAIVAGAGLELRLGKLRLSSEARYLRWGEAPANATVRLNRNQGEILFGLIF